jgi:hypothetical protein
MSKGSLEKVPILRETKRHVFPHVNLCIELFIKWEKYDHEIIRDLTPISPEG